MAAARDANAEVHREAPNVLLAESNIIRLIVEQTHREDEPSRKSAFLCA